mmetsp:Transcript_4821/g.11772  ORF Transcript_4821/g.11772 Transcript_4821/m.11772 type:complete len:432 (+) Transcript_4821:95-1390(+)
MLLFAAASLSFWAFPAPLLHRAAPRLLMQQPHLSEHEESASPPREAPAPAIDPPQVEKVDKPTPIIVHESGSQCGRVLLIYTGGTLGMIKNDGAWLPHHESGNLGRLIQLMPEFHDDKMPDMDMIEYAPLLDSSNIGPKDWCSLAGQIGVHYYDYDGFVVIHGTDTMAYTASALSFMLEGLGKAVVLTGSIIPMREPFNDARRNLIASIMIASQLELSEVAIFFDNQLLRGNRAVKSDTHGLEGFTSPNFPPLALVGADGITARDRRLWRPQPVCRLRVHTNLEVNTVVIRLTPGFDDSAINAMIQHAPNLRGLVLSLYGTGNGPSHKEDFMRVVREAVRRDILVVAVTQCLRGAVTLDTYEVGRRLLEIGVISAGDMTCEAVVTKISYLCGRGLKGEDLRNAMTTDLRGEVTTASAVQDNHVRLYRAERL